MALIACKECGNNVSTEAAACPHCGAVPAKKPAEKKTSGVAVFGMGAVGLLAAFLLIGAMSGPTTDPKALARLSIDECWREQARKSHDGGTARLVAGACEELERRFRQTYNHAP